MEKMNSFLSCFKNLTTCIAQSVIQTSVAVVSRNRQHIASMLHTIEYCGCQGIALRMYPCLMKLLEEVLKN